MQVIQPESGGLIKAWVDGVEFEEATRRRFMDLTVPEYAYMLGFLQADGHLRGSNSSKGALTVELGEIDRVILERFAELTPYHSSIRSRTRDTNFKRGVTSVTWSVFNQDARRAMNEAGLPYGKKSATIAPPSAPFARSDYLRGLIDADGSCGVAKDGRPFISFVTTSEAVAIEVSRLFSSFYGASKLIRRNRRDGMFAPSLFAEEAQGALRMLYYPGALCLPRKLEAATRALAWRRPPGVPKIRRLLWECDELDDLVRHGGDIYSVARALGRTPKSVAARRRRINQADHARHSEARE